MAYYEPFTALSAGARNLDKVIESLREELEAINYYHQRADVTDDETVAALMIHNRNEEIEHAAMLVEWLRRKVPEFDKELRQYLFTEAPITEVEAEAMAGSSAKAGDDGDASLSIGSLR